MKHFLHHIGLKIFGVDHYWGRFEFAKSTGQIYLHLLGIISEASQNNRIYDKLNKASGNREKQIKLLADWACSKFNMTEEVEIDRSSELKEKEC